MPHDHPPLIPEETLLAISVTTAALETDTYDGYIYEALTSRPNAVSAGLLNLVDHYLLPRLVPDPDDRRRLLQEIAHEVTQPDD